METQYISLNMTPTGVNPCFHISQYDIGRPLGVKVHNGAEVVDLDSYTCTIEATRSDGVAITASVATNDNIGTFETTATMTNKADKYKAQFVIVDADSKRIASLPFDMDVCKAAMDENSESIEEDASLYQQYTETVQGAIAEANADIQAEENARIAAVSAEATARQNADATLQNKIDAEATARQTADNTLQGNINSEASTRASADSNLQSQINQIVAPSGEAPSAAEVQNARIGADGVTYSTLGDAIRTNDNKLKSALDYAGIGNNFDGILYNGYWNASGVLTSASYDVCNQNKIDCDSGDTIVIKADTSVTDAAIFISYIGDNGRIRRDDVVGKSYTGTAPAGTKWLCFCFEKVGITKDNFGSVAVYINHSIDKLNAELTYQIGKVDSLNEDIDEIYTKTKNILVDLSYTDGYLYDINNQGFTKSQAPSNDWKAFNVINIEAGKTYYYVSIRGYFSKIIYNNGTSARLTDTDATSNGSFTAAADGRIGLTTATVRDAIFTESEETYNNFIITAQNTLNANLNIPQLDNIVNSNDYFMNRVNLIENYETVINRGYGRGETWLSDNNAFAALTEPIPVKAGVTYYYRNIWAYFCAYRSKEGVVTTITDNTDGMASGSFIPTVDGNLYITLNKLSVAEYSPLSNQDHVNKFLLTTSKEMYEDNVWHTQERNHVFHVGANYEYTNLVAAIIEANKYMDSTVYIHDGEHDFITEIPAVFGDSYIESVDGSHRGVYLKNRIHLIFASNASIVCNYTGSTQSVRQWLAVFNAGQHGFTIENATIKGSNLRYIIHDERDQDTEQYTNRYINCKMHFDNSGNTDWEGNNCIGGGLGRNGHIVVDGCYFESVRRSGQSATGENARGIVTYHNSAGSGKNGIDIHDSYIANVGTVRVTWYGSSPATQKTVAMVSGCSLGSEIISRAEDSSATIENVEMIAWGNEIRTN